LSNNVSSGGKSKKAILNPLTKTSLNKELIEKLVLENLIDYFYHPLSLVKTRSPGSCYFF